MSKRSRRRTKILLIKAIIFSQIYIKVYYKNMDIKIYCAITATCVDWTIVCVARLCWMTHAIIRHPLPRPNGHFLSLLPFLISCQKKRHHNNDKSWRKEIKTKETKRPDNEAAENCQRRKTRKRKLEPNKLCERKRQRRKRSFTREKISKKKQKIYNIKKKERNIITSRIVRKLKVSNRPRKTIDEEEDSRARVIHSHVFN